MDIYLAKKFLACLNMKYVDIFFTDYQVSCNTTKVSRVPLSKLLESTVSSTDAVAKKTSETSYHW